MTETVTNTANAAHELLAQGQTCPRDTDGRPRRFSGAQGAYVTDIDGSRWIDLDNGRGSVLLGHADPEVAEAVARAARGEVGTTTGWSPLLDQVLQRGQALLGGETISLHRTGTAAVRSVVHAVRRARSEQLGVDDPVVLSAGYHGYDPMWAYPDAPFTINSDGILHFVFETEFLEESLRANAGRVAALVLSPDRGSFTSSWYARVGALAREFDVPIVADEVKVGLRHAPDLVTRHLEPDVWIVAKAIANGAPIAMAGGRRDLLSALSEESFTSFFEPTVLAAADVTLARVATGEPQRSIATNGASFVRTAQAVLDVAGLPIEIAGDPSLFHFVCASEELEDAFLAACVEQRILLFERDNQCPSEALRGDVLADLCARFEAAVASVSGRWSEDIDELARYRAAWRSVDGLADRPRARGEGRKIVARLWDE